MTMSITCGKNTSADDIKAFFANLEKVCLEHIACGRPVHLEKTNDVAPDEVNAGHPIQDHVYMGCTWTICVGRPAAMAAANFVLNQAIGV